MTTPFRFDPVELPAECETLREKARGFIAEELAAGYWTPNSDFGSHRDPGFSRCREDGNAVLHGSRALIASKLISSAI
jgi:hypothetical protein